MHLIALKTNLKFQFMVQLNRYNHRYHFKYQTMRFFIFLAISIVSLSAFGQMSSSFKVGDDAPLFEGADQNGKMISLEQQLEASEQVVLIFYRGAWCPYCKKHLSEVQENFQAILDKNSSVIVVTPEKAGSIEKMVSKTGATFSILHDEDYKIMKAYNLDFKIDKETVPRFYNYVLNGTREANENEDDILPIPATYVIDKNGKIKYLHFDEDYRNRSSIEDVLKNL